MSAKSFPKTRKIIEDSRVSQEIKEFLLKNLKDLEDSDNIGYDFGYFMGVIHTLARFKSVSMSFNDSVYLSMNSEWLP